MSSQKPAASSEELGYASALLMHLVYEGLAVKAKPQPPILSQKELL